MFHKLHSVTPTHMHPHEVTSHPLMQQLMGAGSQKVLNFPNAPPCILNHPRQRVPRSPPLHLHTLNLVTPTDLSVLKDIVACTGRFV